MAKSEICFNAKSNSNHKEVGKLYFINNNDCTIVVMCTFSDNDNNCSVFSGTVVYVLYKTKPGGETHLGMQVNNWSKKSYLPFKGSLTLYEE